MANADAGDRGGGCTPVDVAIVSVMHTSRISSSTSAGMDALIESNQACASSSSSQGAGTPSKAIWPLEIRYASSGSCILPSPEQGRTATPWPASRQENVRIDANLPEPRIRIVLRAARVGVDVDASCCAGRGAVNASNREAPLSGLGQAGETELGAAMLA